MNYAEAKKKAAQINKTLSANNFNHIAHVVHTDGSVMLLTHAYVDAIENWWLIFTEHNGWHVFEMDDVRLLEQYQHV